jgi:hypothetical protein
VLSLSLSLLLLLQAMLCLLLLLLKVLWQIDMSSHWSTPHRVKLCLGHWIHAIWHSHRNLPAVLLGQHSLSGSLGLSLLVNYLLLLHVLQLRIARD